MKKLLSLILIVAMLSTISVAALADTTGLGMVFYIYGGHSKNATADADGAVEVDTTACAVTLGADGKITNISFDVAQGKGAFNAKGEITSAMDAALKTKKELGDDYGMRKASAIGKEVNEQIAALEAWCIGKTVDEVVAKCITEGDNADADLIAGCTISVGDYVKALQAAAANAK